MKVKNYITLRKHLAILCLSILTIGLTPATAKENCVSDEDLLNGREKGKLACTLEGLLYQYGKGEEVAKYLFSRQEISDTDYYPYTRIYTNSSLYPEREVSDLHLNRLNKIAILIYATSLIENPLKKRIYSIAVNGEYDYFMRDLDRYVYHSLPKTAYETIQIKNLTEVGLNSLSEMNCFVDNDFPSKSVPEILNTQNYIDCIGE